MGPTSQEFNVGVSGEFLWGKTTWPRGELKPFSSNVPGSPPTRHRSMSSDRATQVQRSLRVNNTDHGVLEVHPSL